MTLKELRQTLHITQQELAESLGITRFAVSKAEKRDPNWRSLDRLISGLGGRLEVKATIGENVFFLQIPVACKCGHDREDHDGDDHDPEDVLGACLSRDPKDPTKRSGCSCRCYRRAPVPNSDQYAMKRRWARVKARCPKRESNGVQCELATGHGAECACPKAIEAWMDRRTPKKENA